MKTKSSGTLHERLNVRGFRQIDGQHYNDTGISVPVTNAMTIRIALSIMLMQGGIAHVVDVKGAFLYGKNSRMGRKSISRFHWDLSNSTQAIQFFYQRKRFMDSSKRQWLSTGNFLRQRRILG